MTAQQSPRRRCSRSGRAPSGTGLDESECASTFASRSVAGPRCGDAHRAPHGSPLTDRSAGRGQIGQRRNQCGEAVAEQEQEGSCCGLGSARRRAARGSDSRPAAGSTVSSAGCATEGQAVADLVCHAGATARVPFPVSHWPAETLSQVSWPGADRAQPAGARQGRPPGRDRLTLRDRHPGFAEAHSAAFDMGGNLVAEVAVRGRAEPDGSCAATCRPDG